MFALRPVPEGERPPVLLLRLRQRSVPPCPQPSLLALLEECKPDAGHHREDLRAPMSLPRMSRTSSVRALGSDLARAIAPSSPSPQLSMSAQTKTKPTSDRSFPELKRKRRRAVSYASGGGRRLGACERQAPGRLHLPFPCCRGPSTRADSRAGRARSRAPQTP